MGGFRFLWQILVEDFGMQANREGRVKRGIYPKLGNFTTNNIRDYL